VLSEHFNKIIHYKFESGYLDLFIGSEVLSKNFRWAHRVLVISPVFSLVDVQFIVQIVTLSTFSIQKVL